MSDLSFSSRLGLPRPTAALRLLVYLLWFIYVVGALQLLGAVLLWTRGCVAFGAGLLAVLMVSAVGSHLLAGDPALCCSLLSCS